MVKEVAGTQSVVKEIMEGSQKLQILALFERAKEMFRYTEREKTVVQIHLAKKSLEKTLRQGVNAEKAFQHVENAEKFFVERDYGRACDEALMAQRRLQVERTRDLDPLFTAGRVKRSYPEPPENDTERKHLVLRIIAELDRRQEFFTEKQIQGVLDEAYPRKADVLLRTGKQVLETHEDVEEKAVFAGISLYVWRGESLS